MDNESTWHHDLFTHWTSISGAPSSTNALTDNGPTQCRMQFEGSANGGWPGTNYSAAFNLDFTAALLRWMFDAGSQHYAHSERGNSTFPIESDIWRCLETHNMGWGSMCGAQVNDGWNADYVVTILGGTVGLTDTCLVMSHAAGSVQTGRVNSKPWIAETDQGGFRTHTYGTRVVL